MKESKQCPKCHSLEIGYMERMYEFCEAPSSSGHPFAPVSVGYMKTEAAEREIPVGHIEAFICTKCGYYETYVKDPESVPFQFLEGFRWLNPHPRDSGPYR